MKKSLTLTLALLVCAVTVGASSASTSSLINQISASEADKAQKEAQADSNNRGVVLSSDTSASAKEASVAESAAVAKNEVKAEIKKEAQPAPEPSAIKMSPTSESQATAAAPAPTSAESAAPAVAANPALSGYPIKPSPLAPTPEETEQTLLVSGEWLKANRTKVLLIDARPESLFNSGKGHIPGAINAPWTYFANTTVATGTDTWGSIYKEATMAKRLGALGIDGKKTVIVYDDGGGWGQCGWTVWILRQCGIKNAKILEGGLMAWNKVGGEYTKNKTVVKPAVFKLTKYVDGYNVTTEWLKNNLGKPNLKLIDVRTEMEYKGKIAPFQEKRRGHLPGSIHIPREDFIDDNCEVKPLEEIREMVARYGITTDDEIVCIDTAGVRASFTALVLQCCGFNKARGYDSGFQAWAGHKELPLEQ